MVYSATWEKHLHHLGDELRCIQEAGMTIYLLNCAIAKEEVQYLGHVVGWSAIQPQLDKVQAIQDCPRP